MGTPRRLAACPNAQQCNAKACPAMWWCCFSKGPLDLLGAVRNPKLLTAKNAKKCREGRKEKRKIRIAIGTILLRRHRKTSGRAAML